jgi:hypothetical protein
MGRWRCMAQLALTQRSACLQSYCSCGALPLLALVNKKRHNSARRVIHVVSKTPRSQSSRRWPTAKHPKEGNRTRRFGKPPRLSSTGNRTNIGSGGALRVCATRPTSRDDASQRTLRVLTASSSPERHAIACRTIYRKCAGRYRPRAWRAGRRPRVCAGCC